MAGRGDVLHLFRQALNSDSGGIRMRFATEGEALRTRKACYNYRDALRAKAARKRPDPRRQLGNTPLYDMNGNLVAIADVMHSRGKAETEFDCLQFRVVGREFVILRIAERVLKEAHHTGALPVAQEMSRNDIGALPPWPLRSARADRGRFTGRQVW
jgi:hypothetical protein